MPTTDYSKNDKKSLSKVFVYPQLPSVYDFGIIRFRGSGLANCLFIVSRAYLIAKKNNWEIINPTWGNFSFGPYIRHEKDKRHYFGLFKSIGISGIHKLTLLASLKKTDYNELNADSKGIVKVAGLGNYFEDLLTEHLNVKTLILGMLEDKISNFIQNISLNNTIGIHIRLGDFSSEMRTEINWYVKITKHIFEKYNDNYKFYIFSDGTDNELSQLLSLPLVERAFYGNAISDIIALSKCRLIIGSDSTFSGWSAFLGQNPIIFPKKHFGKVLKNTEYEYIDSDKFDFNEMDKFISKVLSN